MYYETVIVGAGPAGLTAAIVLAQAGKRVLVLEKDDFYGNKVCAGGLTRKCFNYIPEKIIDRKFDTIYFRLGRKKVKINLGEQSIGMVDRKKLAGCLLEKATKAGSVIWKNAKVRKITKESVEIEKDNNIKVVNFGYLIGADGSHSIVRKYLGLKNNNSILAMQYVIKKKSKNLEVIFDVKNYDGYLYIFPHSEHTFVGVGTDLHRNKNAVIIKDQLKNFIKKRYKENPEKLEFQADIINYDYQGHEFGNIFLIGDAAGFGSSLTGEGIYQAMASGEEVAKKILNKNFAYEKISRILHYEKYKRIFLRISQKNVFFRWLCWKFLLYMARHHTKWLFERIN